jgi:uncharacterized coiled-coil protein SlyX
MFSRLILFSAIIIASASTLSAQPVPNPAGPQLPPKTYARGYVRPANLAAMKATSHAKHDAMMKALPVVTAASWDSRTLGFIVPVQNQGSCGSCWDVSGNVLVSCMMVKAGYGKNDGTFVTSASYVMNCGASLGYRNGGCNGDDYSTVFGIALKGGGLPINADYGAYTPYRATCKSTSGITLHKIDDWGYVDGTANGVVDTQLVKNAIVKYGAVGTAVSASGWDSYSGGVFTNHGGGIDHEVLIIGWDDTKGKAGCWLVMNQWATSWGENGFMWSEYGANSVTTDAAWVQVNPIVPPAPPVPPTPPVPPAPVLGNVIYLTTPLAAGQYIIADPTTSVVITADELTAATTTIATLTAQAATLQAAVDQLTAQLQSITTRLQYVDPPAPAPTPAAVEEAKPEKNTSSDLIPVVVPALTFPFLWFDEIETRYATEAGFSLVA